MAENRLSSYWFAACMGLLVLIVGLEVVCRAYVARPVSYLKASEDPELLYQLKPGLHISNGTLFKIPEYSVAIARNGCRADNLDSRTPYAEVLFVGDSFTFGQGVDFQDVFTSDVQSSLRNNTGLNDLQVANCAVDGYNLIQIVRSAEIHAERIRPKVLVVSLFSNDLESPLQLQELFPKNEFQEFILNKSRLFRVLRLLTVMPVNQSQAAMLREKEIVSLVGRLDSLSHDLGIKVVYLVLSPLYHPDFKFVHYLESKRNAVLKAPELSQDYVIPRNGHWNVRGHSKIASWLSPKLTKLLEDSW